MYVQEPDGALHSKNARIPEKGVEFVGRNSISLGAIGAAYARSGRVDEAKGILEEL